MSTLLKEMDDWFQYTHNINKPLYDYQKNTIKLLQEGKSVIINKSRQTGLSTLMACYGLYRALKGETVIIASPSLKQSKHMMDYIKNFLTTLRRLHEVPVDEETKTSIIFANKGEIHSLPNSASTIRGFRAHFVILDEFAHFLNNSDYDVLQAIIPMVSRGGQIIYISTPFGERGQFYERWANDPTLEKVKIHWEECEDLDVEMIRKTVDEITFRQEYCNEFIGEVNSYFPYGLLEPCMDNDMELIT